MIEEQNELYYSLNHYLNSEDDNPELALKIARGYQKMFRRGFGVPEQTTRLTLKTTLLNLKKYRGTPFYKILMRLSGFVHRELTPFVSYFFIHGSLATLDYVPGFSDLDTFVFVKKDTCGQPEKLKQFKDKLALAQNLLKEIDPNGHHGFLCCNEANLNHYCNAYMPIPVFRNAKILLGPKRIAFHLRDSQTEHEQVFERFARILLDKKRFAPNAVTTFGFKYFISVLLLMPTLYLQARGSILYKKHAFKLYTHSLLDKATLVRKNFSRKSLKKLILLLGQDYLSQTKNMVKEMKRGIKTQKHQDSLYINSPRLVSISVYEKARRELIKKFENNHDVAAIYEYGRIQSPGISDLDLIVVTQSNLKSSQPADYTITTEEFPYASRVATGTLMVVNKKDFADIQLFDEVNLKLLYGEKIPLNRLSASDLKYREIASVADWLPERLTRLTRMLKQPRFDIRNSLLYLRSFCYVLERVSKLTGDPYFAQMTHEVLKARSLWLNRKATDLRYLVMRLVYTGYEAMAAFTDRFFNKPCRTEGELLLFPWQRILFTANAAEVDPDLAISFSTLDTTTLPVSSTLLPHFLTYSRQPGVLSRQMRKQLKTNMRPQTNINRGYENFLKKKMDLANRYADFLLANDLKTGLYRFGFYLQSYLKSLKN
ncbi:MAG: hypothetical protein AAB642_01095 [Patescibacteria group bacterium]